MSQTASIGNRVWLEADGDGISETGELGLGCVTVTVFDSNDHQVAQTTTATDGFYVVNGLAPHTAYTVKFDASAACDANGRPLQFIGGAQPTAQMAGSDAALSSSPDALGMASVTTPYSGMGVVDAGFVGLINSHGPAPAVLEESAASAP